MDPWHGVLAHTLAPIGLQPLQRLNLECDAEEEEEDEGGEC